MYLVPLCPHSVILLKNSTRLVRQDSLLSINSTILPLSPDTIFIHILCYRLCHLTRGRSQTHQNVVWKILARLLSVAGSYADSSPILLHAACNDRLHFWTASLQFHMWVPSWWIPSNPAAKTLYKNMHGLIPSACLFQTNLTLLTDYQKKNYQVWDSPQTSSPVEKKKSKSFTELLCCDIITPECSSCISVIS